MSQKNKDYAKGRNINPLEDIKLQLVLYVNFVEWLRDEKGIDISSLMKEFNSIEYDGPGPEFVIKLLNR